MPVSSNVKTCNQCFAPFVVTVFSLETCLFCIKKVDPNPERKYKYLTTNSTGAFNKAEYKKKFPERVKAWNDRYREKNRERLRARDRSLYENEAFRQRRIENASFYYYLKKEATMRAVNDSVIVKIEKASNDVVTTAGIIIPKDNENTIKTGKIKYVCVNPSEDVKVGDMIGFEGGVPFQVQGVEYITVKIKDIIYVEK